jgi:hypothetical protein
MRILCAVPWAVMRVDAGVRRALRGFGGVWLLVAALLVTASVPVILEGARTQPLGESIDGLRDGVSSMATWVRMSGTITTISSPESVAAGQSISSLLVEPSGDAILLLSNRTIDELTTITGRVTGSTHAADTARGIAGPRLPAGDLDIIDGYLIAVDDPIVPAKSANWWPVWLLIGLAALLVIGWRVGYPVVLLRRGAALAANAAPLRIGESVDVRLVEREDETSFRSTAPHGTFRRLPRHDPTDPYFSLLVRGAPRPMEFRRHHWSAADPGTLAYVAEQMPVLSVHDWGVDALMAFSTVADRDRVHASFSRDLGDGVGDLADTEAERDEDAAASA